MDIEKKENLKETLARLKQEHHDLDTATKALEQIGGADQLQVTRLKKQKLALRDQITKIEDKLFPDIIA